MKFTFPTLAAAALVGYSANAFQAPPMSSGRLTSRVSRVAMTSSTTKEEGPPPCAMPDDVIPEGVTAKALRSALLTNANGEMVRLNEKMGSGTSIVIFLRHLG